MHSKIRILYIIDSLGFGGSQRQLVELASRLDRSVFDPYVLIYHKDDSFRKVLDDRNVPIVYIRKKMKVDPTFMLKLAKFIKENEFQIINCFWHGPNFIGRLIGKLSGVSVVITSVRDVDVTGPLYGLLERVMYPLSTKIVVNAVFLRDVLLNSLHIPEIKISVIPNGVDTNLFTPLESYDTCVLRELKLNLGILENEFVILLIGRIESQKNHICLVKALDVLRKLTAVKFKALFVGNIVDEKLKAILDKEIISRGFGRTIKFLDPCLDIQFYYSIGNIVVLPSLHEGMSNVLLEAMASGKVVVASDIPANREIVADGENGYLFNSNNYESLARTIFRVMSAPCKRLNSLSQAAAEYVQKEHNVEKMVKSMTVLYKNLLAESR
ncbi:MAG: glycosyltransferase [Candidatus Omnitrophica bacterium]|nr:glycosyltransferase [Candidatus Omnitrophota bacterium]